MVHPIDILLPVFTFTAAFFALFILVSGNFFIAAFAGGVGCAIGAAIGAQAPLEDTLTDENSSST
jgi:uncharacterized membrane protein YphA (DoxX/SURF4 family)